MNRKVKWGVIGSGGIADRRTIPEGLLPAEHAELISVYDINSEINHSVASKYGVDATGSIPELLSSEIDAVYIGSPVHLHKEHVIACASAGKHVLSEKPLGLSVDEAENMIQACEKEGKLLGVGYMMRYHAQHKAAKTIIEEGKLGIPLHARAQLSCWYPPIEGAWRQDPSTGGGGSLMDMGSHCIDLLEMLFGEITRIACFINNSVHSYKSEDSAVASLFFANGAIGTVDAFFCIPDESSKNVLELYGSKGSILARGTIGQGETGEMLAYLSESEEDYNAQQERSPEDGITIKPDPVNTYYAEIEDFSLAVLEGRQPSNNATIGLRNQKVLAACYQSARTGKFVEIT